MKKFFVLSFLLFFNIQSFYGQVVETLIQHPKIGDGLHVDKDGNVYTASGGLVNGTEIGKYDIASNTFKFDFMVGVFGPIDIDQRANGDFIVTNFDNNTVSSINPSNGFATTIATGLDGPAGIAIDGNDNIYISNFGAYPTYKGHQIHKITPSGVVSVLADSSLLLTFQAMIFNGKGELIVSSQNKLLKVDTETGALTVWVDLGNLSFGHMVYRTIDSCIYATATSQSKIYKINNEGVATIYAGGVSGIQDGDLATAQFKNPLGIGISPNENVIYVGDANRLRRIIIDVNARTSEFEVAEHKIFPNPSENGLFSIENIKRETLIIEVFDQVGRRVISIKDNKDLIELDLSNQKKGLYHLQLFTDSKVYYQKLITTP